MAWSPFKITKMIDLVLKNHTDNKKFNKSFFEKIIKKCLLLAAPELKDISVSINLVTAQEIAKLNLKYRKKTGATDVISFPVNEEVSFKDNKNDTIDLGDIFICPEIAEAKSKTSLTDEMIFLTVHGLLHLLGHDHEKSEKDKKIMFSLQEKIINR